MSVSMDVDAFRGAAGRLPSLPRLEVIRPRADRGDGQVSLPLDIQVSDAKRIQIHFFCTTGHIVLERTPTKLGQGGTWSKEGRYTEDLTQLLEYAALFDQPGQRRAYLFIVAYDEEKGGRPSAIMNGFFSCETTIKREKPQ
jgi:hypothetical protein